MNQELLIEAWKAVININQDIFNSISSEKQQLNLVVLNTDGDSIIVTFCGWNMWHDANEDREFNEEKNEYESLEPFIRKIINQNLELIKKIKV